MGCLAAFAATLAFLVAMAGAEAKPHYPGPFVADKKLDALQKKLKAPGARIEEPCRSAGVDGADCPARALDRVQSKLAKRAETGLPVRILHLGDSHVAADYITSRIRRDLQAQYGNGGRGFVHVDQRWGYGGRRTSATEARWIRDRIVDSGRAGRPYGFSGLSLTARKKGASVQYRVRPDDRSVRIFYGPSAKAAVTVWLDKRKLGRFELPQDRASIEIPIPDDRTPRKYKRGPAGNTLRVRAERKGVAIYGLSFEGGSAGVQYSSIGPVGADAKVYLQLDEDSFTDHLRTYRPDLVVYMVGGNDALKIRKRWTTLPKVTDDHKRLLRLVRTTLPESDCLMWAPMVAGRRQRGRVVSKRYLAEVRDMQRKVALEAGCAFWDTMEAMGGAPAIARWAPFMAKDLVHPRKSAADLVGRMFVQAWSKLD